jgi:RNA polymerase primary sigma factor/RNA polymerase sigma factor
VDRFVARNRDRVVRGGTFHPLTEDEKDRLIEYARRLARAGGMPSEVIRRVARQFGRSAETARYTIKAFDERHPDLAIFPGANTPLTEEVKKRIYQQHRAGTSTEMLAKRFSRTRSSIYRIVNEMRAKRILDLPLDYIDSPEFHVSGAEGKILGDLTISDEPVKKPRSPSGLPPYLASLYEVPLLTREKEVVLFRRMNFLKFQAKSLRDGLDPAHARSSVMDKIESLNARAVDVKNQIVRANLRLVVSIAKRHVDKNDNFFELVSDGNVSLIRAADKFDYTRGNKFSTYASWAIMKNFARTIPGENRHRDRYRTTTHEVFDAAEEPRSNPYLLENEQRDRERDVGKILSHLDDREQQIIIRRYGLAQGTEPLTLKELGVELGVTKERVRQIEARALGKLRAAVKEERVEDPVG